MLQHVMLFMGLQDTQYGCLYYFQMRMRTNLK